jgi:hypothetical protein
MSNANGTGDAPDPTAVREEVEQELRDLTEAAAGDEVERMAERDRAGVDEPNDEGDQTPS